MTDSQDKFEKDSMPFMARVWPIILIAVIVIISTTVFAVNTRLPLFICFFISFFLGGFIGLFIIFLIEKFRPKKELHPSHTFRRSENANQFEEDIRVITSLSQSLENLPVDRLPRVSDLEYSIARIKDAIDRLKLNRDTPKHLMQALNTSENLLLLFITDLARPTE
jgi:hypothetical protein